MLALTPICFVRGSCFIYVSYIYWLSYQMILASFKNSMTVRFPYQMICVLFKSNTMDATSGAGTADLTEYLSSPPVISGVLVAQSLVFCVEFCRSLIVLFLLTIICSSSIYCFWLPLWYHRRFLCRCLETWKHLRRVSRLEPTVAMLGLFT